MTSQLNYLFVQHRHIELVYRAEQARLAREAHAAGSAPSSPWKLRRLLAPPRLRAARVAPAVTQASLGASQACVRCDT